MKRRLEQFEEKHEPKKKVMKLGEDLMTRQTVLKALGIQIGRLAEDKSKIGAKTKSSVLPKRRSLDFQ